MIGIVLFPLFPERFWWPEGLAVDSILLRASDPGVVGGLTEKGGQLGRGWILYTWLAQTPRFLIQIANPVSASISQSVSASKFLIGQTRAFSNEHLGRKIAGRGKQLILVHSFFSQLTKGYSEGQVS